MLTEERENKKAFLVKGHKEKKIDKRCGKKTDSKKL